MLGLVIDGKLIEHYGVRKRGSHAIEVAPCGVRNAPVVAEQGLLGRELFFLAHLGRRLIFRDECEVLDEPVELLRYGVRKFFFYKFFKCFPRHVRSNTPTICRLLEYLSVMFNEPAEFLSYLFHLGVYDELAVRSLLVRLVVFLVIVLRRIKCFERPDLRGHLLHASARVEHFYIVLGLFLLLVRRIEDGRVVLLPDIIPLPARLRRVMRGEEDAEKFLERELVRVERNFRHFDVPGASAAHLFISGVLRRASRVARLHRLHSLEHLEHGFGTPKTSGTKYNSFHFNVIAPEAMPRSKLCFAAGIPRRTLLSHSQKYCTMRPD